VRQGKGRRDRVAFLGAKARKALLKYLLTRPDAEPAEPLFPSVRTGERLKPNGLLLLCRRLGARAGVEHCHPHTFRRTFALWSLRAGMNIYALQQIMGHSDLEVLAQVPGVGRGGPGGRAPQARCGRQHALAAPVMNRTQRIRFRHAWKVTLHRHVRADVRRTKEES
jgi:integrase